MKFSLLGIEIYSHVKNFYCSAPQPGCILTDVQGVYRPFSRLWECSQLIWSTEQQDYFIEAKISFVLSSSLAAFPQT